MDFERIAIIDRLVIRMAIVNLNISIYSTESLYFGSHWNCQIYSTDDSSAFVNGILDAVLHDISDILTYKLKRSETKSATREE